MTQLTDLPRPLVMAHRGDAVHAPENSPAAFGLALERGADLLETDLWRTRDGVLVCHHDRTLDRATDSTGAIPELTLAEVKRARVIRSYCGRYDEGQYPDERILTLRELLSAVPEEKGLALELKDPALAEPENARQLVSAIGARIEDQTVMLLSFHTRLLRAAKRADPRVWIGKIGMFSPLPFFRGNGIGTTWPAMRANPLYTLIARAQGLWVCPLDPTPEERLKWYLELGVDAVLTDDPARTRKALAVLRSTPSEGRTDVQTRGERHG
jgi:glycerophosphoryl diester phosphodiesterase